MTPEILGLLRHVLTFVGGIIVAKGLIDESLSQEIIGALMTIAGGAWSVLSKKK
jgi:hypothetical protein